MARRYPKSAVPSPALRRARLRHVLLLVDTSRSYGRGLIRGVARYNQEHGRWSIYFKPHALDAAPPFWLKESQADGILARVGGPRMAKAILACGVPAVDLRGVVADLPIPFVGVDHAAVARIASEHLLERGFQQFAFCGLPRGIHPHMDQLCDSFVTQLEQAGHSCRVFSAHSGPRPGEAWEKQQNRTDQWTDRQRLARWIRSLSKPVAILACHDDRALQVLDACRHVGVYVPEEAAVVSVDNDPYLCELAMPPLSSIDENPQEIGYQAAALLDQLMDGQAPPSEPIRVQPQGVVSRRSTDVLAIENPHVARALRVIHTHASDGILPRDVIDQIPASRTALALEFKQVLGRTIGQELRRVRVEHVRQLLRDTDLSIKQVAHRAGFHQVEYMTRVFHREVGQTPARYRKACSSN